MKSPHKVETEGRGRGREGAARGALRGDLMESLIFTCLCHAATQLRETRLHPLQLLPVLSSAHDEGEQVFLQEAGWAGGVRIWVIVHQSLILQTSLLPVTTRLWKLSKQTPSMKEASESYETVVHSNQVKILSE